MAKILCVDDEKAVTTLKKQILEQAGHSVTTCDSADQAVLLLAQMDFDAVVTDWRLGEDRGRRIVEAAKSKSSVPVVVVSGYVAEAFQSADPPADLYLEKPADPRELLEILETLLGKERDREYPANF